MHWLVRHYSGNVLLAAPTAITATNIEGKTINSLFHLPLGWITKDCIKDTPYRLDIQKSKLLIIDKISMVNANILDGVSGFLRKNRNINKPFGGLPVVMVGDLFQLHPVVKKSVKELFERVYYGQTKFYSAKCLTETGINYYPLHSAHQPMSKEQTFLMRYFNLYLQILFSGSHTDI